MQFLGYVYSETKKTYYTDGHEREDVIKNRDYRFLEAYFEYEQRCHRLIHIKKQDTILLGKKHPTFQVDECYTFKKDDIEYNEYHMDTYLCLQYEDHRPFEYKISVRKPDNVKPLIIFGQDESTYHQFIFSKKIWKSNTGASYIQPKGMGEILMISAFQSRKTGLGLGHYLSDEIRREVNANRKGKSYLLKDDTKLIYGSDTKSDINNDPMLQYFSAGANEEVYWTSLHAKL